MRTRTMQAYTPRQIILILAPFVFSFAFGLDIYIPIIPQMTEIFATSQSTVHLTLSLFLTFTGLGQLFLGPLSDMMGRKWLFYLASVGYVVGALLCATATHITWLIAGRIVCACGACGLLVTSFAVVRDLYSHTESARMYGYLNGAVGISPMFAPIIGGYLSTYLGWQSIFIFLSLIGVVTFFFTRQLIYETLPVQYRVPFDMAVFKRYRAIFSNRQFLIYTLMSGLAEGVFFCFFSISPFIIIDLLGVETHNFGYFFAVFGSVIAFGGLGSGMLIERCGIQKTIALGIALTVVGGISMLAWHYLATLSITSFLLPMVLACTGAIFVVGACASLALEPFAAIAGTAAAAFGALQFSVSALIGAVLMLFPVTSTVPYGLMILLAGLASQILFKIAPAHAQAGVPASSS